MKRAIFVLGCLAGSASGCMELGESETINLDNQELIGGQLDLRQDFNLGLCVGLGILTSCRAGYEDSPVVDWCSATLIAPTVALTSRRCLELPVAGSPNDCSGRFSGVLKDADATVVAANWYLSDRNHWNKVVSVHVPSGDNVCTDNLAVVTLRSPSFAAPMGGGNLPARVNLTRDVAASPPSAVALVGRGFAWERFDPITRRQVERSGGTTRNSIENVPFVCAPGPGARDCSLLDHFNRPPVFSPPEGLFTYGPAATSVDAGGGVFDQAEFGDGPYTLIGIQAGLTIGPDGTVSGGYAVRLDRHADLIRSVVQEEAAARGSPVPGWAQ